MSYVTGETIKRLREEQRMTQKELADRIAVSDKAVSKWETGKGLPDISIIEDLAKALSVSIAELLTGDVRKNENQSANMKRSEFAVCPICGNVITATGSATFSCCGITLPKQEPEACDEEHMLFVDTMDDEWYVTMEHPMTKSHFISYVFYVTSESVETVKLYPEQGIEVRFKKKGHGYIYFYCNKHGMFRKAI